MCYGSQEQKPIEKLKLKLRYTVEITCLSIGDSFSRYRR
jgi:hypothetical protein